MGIFSVASAAHATHPAKELFLPVVGHAVGASGREFSTAVWISNTSSGGADVALTFLKSGQPNPSPRLTTFRIRPGETRLFDPVGAEILGVPDGIGALQISSRRPLVAYASIYSRAATDTRSRQVSMTFAALPASFAIGNGGSALAQGLIISNDFRYKIYIAEITGEPLYCSLEALDLTGREVAQTSLYLGGRAHRVLDIGEQFPSLSVARAVVRIRGVNGNGRVIFAGAQIAAASEDGSVFEMSFAKEPRHALSSGEIVAYVAVALAIIAAALFGRRRQ